MVPLGVNLPSGARVTVLTKKQWARVQKKDAGRDHFCPAQPLPLFLRRDEGGDEVVRRMGAAMPDHLFEVVREGDRGRLRRLFGVDGGDIGMGRPREGRGVHGKDEADQTSETNSENGMEWDLPPIPALV